MRIVIFTNAYEPIVSGVVTAIRFFRQGLIDLGHEVFIFAPDHKDIQDRRKEQTEGIFRFSAVNLTRQLYFPIAVPCYPGLTSLLRRINPDVIHSHHPFVLGKVGLRVARRLGVPLVYTFHTQYEQYSHYFPLPQNLVKWAGRKAVRDYAQSVDLLTTPAESIAGLLRSYGVTKKIHILPNPLDLARYEQIDHEIIRNRYGIGRRKLLLFVGRIGREKNLDFLLRAFARLAEEFGDDIRLMLVGSGAAEEMLKKLAVELGLADRVIFTGAVNYEEIPLYYGAADLFVMTSTSEVKPLVFIEAMAAGLPVVAVEASGSKDTFTSGYNGILTPEEVGAFASAVRELLRNDRRRLEIARAAKESAARYSIKNLTQELLTLYKEAIAEKG
ncbi:MAG TPA: glycosyltransferase family 4 protein [Bacillota bacterium]